MAQHAPLRLVPKLPELRTVIHCLDGKCPYKAAASDHDRAIEKLKGHLAVYHPEYLGGPQEAA